MNRNEEESGLTNIRSVLFVCMGNICRSPTAEAVFRQKALAAGMAIQFDSAGTIGYHQGNLPDPRAVIAGKRRGLQFDGMKARQVVEEDFHRFDLILAADKDNLRELKRRCPIQYQHKLGLVLSFTDGDYDEVPDPYYGGDDGFELVLDLLAQSADNFMRKIKS